jgi:hypothetical protein
MDPLKLIAFDAQDLQVVSAHLQDAVVRIGEMNFIVRQKRFAAVLNRFDWAQALGNGGRDLARRQTALRFERVLSARISGFDLGRKDEVLSLLAIAYAPAGSDDPAGTVTLTFAGGAAVQLDVECIEAELRDLGPVWKARSRPEHPADDGPG